MLDPRRSAGLVEAVEQARFEVVEREADGAHQRAAFGERRRQERGGKRTEVASRRLRVIRSG